MRSPRRLSSPTTSERRRPRSEPSDRPESFKGIWTRRPSARIAIATWRRFRPSNRPKDGLPNKPGEPGRSAQSTRPPVIMQPPGVHRIRLATLSGRLRPPEMHKTAGCPAVLSPPASANRRPASVARPALAGLQNESGSGKRGKDQENPKGLSLEHSSHLIKTSACRRRG